MKRITLLLCALAIGTTSFAQSFPCPNSFKRSNGAGGGCPIAKLTLEFDVCPTIAPNIDSVYYMGAKLDAGFASGIIDCSGTKNVITYCVTTTNIPPSGFLTIYFHENGSFNGTVCVVDGGGSGPVPVLLSSFVAARKGNNVNFKWETSSEINAKEFVLQRKNGTIFTDVATIPARNLANGSSYSYVDNNISKGITEYRIKMVDFGGSYKNSDIRAIKGLSGSSDFTVYPNPSSGNATVALSETFENTVVQLMDHAGRVLKTEKVLNNGSTSFRNMVPGMYLIKVTNSVTGEVMSKKLTVVN